MMSSSKSPACRPISAAQLAEARLRDPFAVLGPHDTGSGRIVRAFLPGAREVEVVARSDGHRIGALLPSQPPGLFVGRVESARGLPPAHHLARRGAGNRRPLFLHPAPAVGQRLVPVQRRPLVRNGVHARRRADDDRRRERRAFCRLGAERAARCRWSAISIPGTRAAIRCGCGFLPACGNCLCRGWNRARAISTPSSAPTGIASR